MKTLFLLLVFVSVGECSQPILKIQLTPTNIVVLITNGDLWCDYILEKSSDLVNWSPASARFETDTNGSVFFFFDKTNSSEFFRLKDDTLIDYGFAVEYDDYMACGHLIGYVNYDSEFGGAWGYVREESMTRHIAYDGGGRTNTIISFRDRYSTEGGCGIHYVYVDETFIGVSHRFSILFTDNLPVEIYPIRLKGFRN